MAQNNTTQEKITRGLQKQLTAYSVAAAATLALAGTADAALIYSGKMNIPLNDPNNPYFIDLDSDGTAEFGLYPFALWGGAAYIVGQTTGAIVGLQPAGTYFPFVKKFNNSYSIVPGNPGNPSQWNVAGVMNGTYIFGLGIGPFNGDHGFFGVKFNIGADVHLGWIEYEGDLNQASGTIVSWAYDQNPVPLPGTLGLGLLSLGAAGVARLRQRKKEAREETA